MNRLTRTILASGIAAMALAAVPAPALADAPIVQSQDAAKAAFDADRETILAMAGPTETLLITDIARQPDPALLQTQLADFRPV